MIENVRYYPENRDTPEEGFKEIDIDDQGNITYIKVIDRSGVYHILPDANTMAMREAVICVDSENVPYEDGPMDEDVEDENKSYELENAIIKIIDERIVSNPKIVETINGNVNEIQMTINELSNKITDVHDKYVLNKMDIDFTSVLAAINTAILNINQNITNNYNKVINVYETNVSNVKINNEFKETINVELQQVKNEITNITIESIKNCLNVVSNNQNILVSDISKINDFMIEMLGQVATKDANNNFVYTHKTPCKKLKTNINNALTYEPEKDDSGLIENNNNNSNDDENNNNRGVMLLKRFRGVNDQDVAKPIRQTYYWNDMITVDEMNEKYSKDYYGMFRVQYITEVPMLDVVNININENNPNIVWDIYDNYINTNNNEVSDSEEGYNPIGVRRFNINVDVPLNNKLVNYFEKISPNEIGYENYNTVTINPTPLKEDIEANYVGDKGVTLYDSNEKIYVNNHKYTIQEENEELNESNNGFNSVIQTSIVPIMDSITLPEVKTNGTVTYRISDFNNSYMMPNSSNIFRNDFIGVDTINIPVNVNRLVIPLNASTAGVYHPTDYNPNAIGFSVVEVVGNSSGGSNSSINNLLDYTFTSNSGIDPNTGDLIPYTIQEYNNAQDPVTSYTGFNNIKVNVPVSNVDNADVDSANNNVITSRTATYLVPSGKTGWNSFRVEVPTDVDNADVDSANNNVITSRNGNYLIPSGKTGWNSFRVEVPTDVNNYDPYPNNNPLIINNNGSGSILFDSSNFTGLNNIYYDCQVSGATINNANVNNNNLITGNGVFSVPNGYTGFNSFEVQTQNKGTYLFNGISNYFNQSYEGNMVSFGDFYELNENQNKEFIFDNSDQTTKYRYFYIYVIAWTDNVNNYNADVCQIIMNNTINNGNSSLPYLKFKLEVSNNEYYVMKAKVYIKILDTNLGISSYQYKSALMYSNNNYGMIMANYLNYSSYYKEVNMSVRSVTKFGSQYVINTINNNNSTVSNSYSFSDNLINKVNKNLIGFLAPNVLPAQINNYQYGTQVGNSNNYIVMASKSYDIGYLDFNIPSGFTGLNEFKVNYVSYNSILCSYLSFDGKIVNLDQSNIIVYDSHTYGNTLSIPSNSALILFVCNYVDNVPTYLNIFGSCSEVYYCEIYINSTGVTQNTNSITPSFSDDNISGIYYLYVSFQLSYDSTTITNKREIKVSKNSDGSGNYIINNIIKIISGQLNYYKIYTRLNNNVLCGIKKVPSINNN